MHQTETHTLHGIALRLLHAIPAHRSEALVLAGWICTRPDVFCALPPVAPMGRHRPGVSSQYWQALGDYIGATLRDMVVPPDQPLARLRTIAAHLGLNADETAILRLLVLQQRRGAVADCTAVLKREIGLSDEAVIALCCNLDETEVWAALAPKAPISALSLFQSDGTRPVMGDEPYALSGLLLALLYPPGQGSSRLML
ncbi:hypothetical protein [Phaeovulum sp. W22_SRMD_FR3]|uniref:hypothetical protein n=1 Tax=Phaeovulum sp. W22_SRMD_FR3 TaxID=3240274 RepID=UPI003F983660